MKDKESKKGFEKNIDLPIPPAIDSLKVSDRCH